MDNGGNYKLSFIRGLVAVVKVTGLTYKLITTTILLGGTIIEVKRLATKKKEKPK